MPYFTTDELRALPDVQDPGRFSDERLTAAHDWIASIVERECDTSFIVKTITETLDGDGSVQLPLSDAYARSITSATVDSDVVDVNTLLLRNGYLRYLDGYTPWSSALANITVTYTAGYSTEPPPDLKEAMMRGARNWLLTSDAWSGKDSRATSISNDGGTIGLVVAGPDRPTGYPDVDTTIMAWARRVRVPKVS